MANLLVNQDKFNSILLIFLCLHNLAFQINNYYVCIAIDSDKSSTTHDFLLKTSHFQIANMRKKGKSDVNPKDAWYVYVEISYILILNSPNRIVRMALLNIWTHLFEA